MAEQQKIPSQNVKKQEKHTEPLPFQNGKALSGKFDWNHARFEDIKNRLLSNERKPESTLALVNELKGSPADAQYYAKLLDNDNQETRSETAQFILFAFGAHGLTISEFLPAFKEMLTRKEKVKTMTHEEARQFFGNDRFTLFLEYDKVGSEMERDRRARDEDKRTYLVERGKESTVDVYLVDYSRMVELTNALDIMVQSRYNPQRQELVEFAEEIFRWWLKTNSLILNNDDLNQKVKQKLIKHLGSGLDMARIKGAKLSDDVNEITNRMFWG